MEQLNNDPTKTTKVELHLTDAELLELYALARGFTIHKPPREFPVISLMYKLDDEVTAKASPDIKVELELLMQAMLAAKDKNLIATQNFQNSFAEITESIAEEREIIESDINDVMGGKDNNQDDDHDHYENENHP